MKNILFRYRRLILIALIPYLFIVIAALVKVPYDIVSPAYVNKVNNVIQVQTTYEEKGSFNTVSVYSYERVSLLNYLLALCDRKTTIERTYEVYNFSNAQGYQAGTIQKDVSIVNAIISGYELAKFYGYDVEISYHYEGYIVDTYYTYMSPNTLQIGDIITKVGDYSLIDSGLSISEALSKADLESPNGVKFEVIRNKQTLTFTLTRNNYINYYGEERSGYGFGGYDYYVIDSATPNYLISHSTSIGPSGGLLQALSVFNALTTNIDLTNGKKIVGTGTIDITGIVGEIGGIYQKIIVSDIVGVDVFFVPVYRYSGYDYRYVKISSQNHWKIGNYETTIVAAQDNIPYINTDGYWYSGSEKINVKALGDIYSVFDETNWDSESNFLEAYRSYYNLNNPKMKLIPISTLEEAVAYLFVDSGQETLLSEYRNAYQYAKHENNSLTIEEWLNEIKEVSQ